MEVVLNGEMRKMPEGLTVAGMLEELGLGGRRVAVEINEEIVSRDAYGSRAVAAGDRIEVVQFVGGG